MSAIRANVTANLIGKFWAVAVSLASVPFLLHLLGIEAFGVVGFHLTLVAIFGVLDLGMGTTLNRTLAQLSVYKGNAQRMRDIVRTLEVVFWLIAALIGLAIFNAASIIAEHWIVGRQFSETEIEYAVALMGMAIAVHWPLSLYSAGLSGLQKQVAANVLASIMATLRNLGAVAVLYMIEPSLQAFFLWQIAVSFSESLLARALLWRRLPQAEKRAAFRAELLREQWRFAAGVMGISVLAVILTQIDKIVLSSVLSLEAFGYYALAWRVASGLFYLVSPITAAFFPRFSQLVAVEDRYELARLYHSGSQFTSVALIPVTVILAFFPGEILFMWTGDARIAASCATLLSLLVVGTAINGLMNLPLALQLAFGWTRLVLFLNVMAVIILAPLAYAAGRVYGGEGAAWVWIVLNVGYVVFMLRAMHKRLLPGQLSAWFFTDVGAPLAASLAVGVIWKAVFAVPQSQIGSVLALTGALGSAVAVSILAAPSVRSLAAIFLFKRQRFGA